jgi:gamma-glutamylcyclotransferase (GGCT)/AIG2-like uncharacterized protein YtfP
VNPHLFVYGSLLSAESHEMGRRLAREAVLVGAATLPGRLYQISWYPGVVDSSAPGELVHGEVFRLIDPAAALAWLDRYEGVTGGPAGGTARGEYARVERTVALATGEQLAVWVYLYQRDASGKRRIESGRWGER